MEHEENAFVTLTYGDEFLPPDGHLDATHLQLWLKRFRRAIAPHRVRFFAVGEYGSESLRPHYHLCMFGVSAQSVFETPGGWATGEQLVHDTWGKGHVLVGEFTPATAGYVTGYVTQKLSDRSSGLKDHLIPEFARMSLRPGIGANSMLTLAKALNNSYGIDFMENNGDIPKDLKVAGRKIPLPRYLIAKLRQAVGFTEEYIAEIKQQATMDKSLEVLALYTNAEATSLDPVKTFSKTYLLEVEQKIRNLESRSKVFKPKRML